MFILKLSSTSCAKSCLDQGLTQSLLLLRDVCVSFCSRWSLPDPICPGQGEQQVCPPAAPLPLPSQPTHAAPGLQRQHKPRRHCLCTQMLYYGQDSGSLQGFLRHLIRRAGPGCEGPRAVLLPRAVLWCSTDSTQTGEFMCQEGKGEAKD